MEQPFKGISVFLSGEFLIEKEELFRKIQVAGTYCVEDITKANVVIIGSGQQSLDVVSQRVKCKFWDGWEILTITEEQALEILLSQGHRYTPEEWGKINGDYWLKKFKVSPRRIDINITFDSLFNTTYSPIVYFTDDKDVPTLEGKEVFMFSMENDPVKLFLEQQGAIVKDTFDPTKTDYCLLRESTLEKLKNGEKDRFIRTIEETYNKSKCSKFPYQFLFNNEMRKTSKLKNIKKGDVDPVEELFENTDWNK